MNIKWELKSAITDSIRKRHPDINPVVLQMVYNRGLKDQEEISRFLQPKYPDFTHSPWLFRQMEEAISAIIKHIKSASRITIYGDYDADGVTSSALLFNTLKTLKAEVDVYIPHRVHEGYGFNMQAVKNLVKNDTKLIISVDSGIRSREEVKTAVNAGVEVIISDHHLPPNDPDDLPSAVIINPNNHGEPYPFKSLAGVGVAFKIAQALIGRAKLDSRDKKSLIDSNLDLVAIGTIADCVSLLGENRVLSAAGIKRLSNTRRIGLRKLMSLAGTDTDNLESWHIGFQIGPRINAAGRMDHAMLAFELLTARDGKQAGLLAAELNRKNQERQSYTDEVMEHMLKEISGNNQEDFLVLVCPGPKQGFNNEWNEGIMGLVAGKLSSLFFRPVIVFTKNKGTLKGSGRSVEGINIMELLEEEKDLLVHYGGHPLACGLKIKESDLAEFKKRLNANIRKKYQGVDISPKIIVDKEMRFGDFSIGLLEELDRLKPFGEGNPRPVFVSSQVLVMDIRYLGSEEKHIKLRLKQAGSRVYSAIGFNQAEDFKDLKVNDIVKICYNLEINDFNGRREIQLKIIDIKSEAA